MKRTIFALGLSLAFALSARETLPDLPRDESGQIVFREVIQVEGATAAELQSRARAWVASTYRSAKDVVQLDDANSGRIVVKGLLPATWKDAFMTRTDDFRHTLTLETKDGRYRYTMDGFAVIWNGTTEEVPIERDLEKHGHTKTAARLYTALAASVQAEIASLKAAMARPAEDW